MRIGLDLDETLTDTAISFDEVMKKNNVNFSKNYFDNWTKDETHYILSNFCEEMIAGAKLKKGVKEAIKVLNNKGHELFIITARRNYYSNNIENITYDLLKKNNIDVKRVYFGQDKKSDLASELHIDLMIDDSISVYNNMKREGIDCILFGDKIKTWDEVLKYIERKEGLNGETH